MGEVLRALFQDAKSLLRKHKKCLLEASYGTSQTSKLEFFTANVNSLQPKTIFTKNPTLDV